MNRFLCLLVLAAFVLAGCGQARPALIEEDSARDETPAGEQDLSAEETELGSDQGGGTEPEADQGEEDEQAGQEYVSLPPCESHTECYLQAREAFDSGERAGYLLTVDRCEYYRGRFQLEQFYGLCLLMLGDAYRHLGRYEDAKGALTRFLTVSSDDMDLAMQARMEIEEIELGEAEPELYADYLAAVSLLRRFNRSRDPRHALEAREKLEHLHSTRPDWGLDESVRFLLEQLDGVRPGGEPADDGA